MRGTLRVLATAGIAIGTLSLAGSADEAFRHLPVKEYRDKMIAGWIGQMAGVAWGAPTEFRYKGRIIPVDEMPTWQPEMINNAFRQDDLYVEMTFLRSLEIHGLDVSRRRAGIDFASTHYSLWHANYHGREALRRGIGPPDSGHPQFNKHADDIDYQIEADFSGVIAPGLPNTAIALGETFGRLMNYGDGLYGGQFVGGMYAEAFFESDPVNIVKAGLRCIPRRSQYAEAIRDVLRWHKKNPDDWEKTWDLINRKYHLNPDYRRFSCTGPKSDFNIDAKINGAYIVMGLLYGERDLDKTIVISTRCGQDSDCNPASAGGVLFTTVGASKLPKRFTSALDKERVFSHTAYNFRRLINVSEKLARQMVLAAGGRIEKDKDGQGVFVIPVTAAKPSKLERSWEPGPIANSRFSDEELQEILRDMIAPHVIKGLRKFVPGWEITGCGQDSNPGLYPAARGKENVFLTHPLNRETACTLSRRVAIPAGKRTTLRLTVGHHPKGDWDLVVKVEGKELLKKLIGKETAVGGWMDLSVDLSFYAGKRITLELLNQANGWSDEAGYWAKIELESK